MPKYAGVALIVLGAILLMFGLNASDSLGSRLSRLFTGAPTDRTIWFLIGGTCAVIVGASMSYAGRGRRAA